MKRVQTVEELNDELLRLEEDQLLLRNAIKSGWSAGGTFAKNPAYERMGQLLKALAKFDYEEAAKYGGSKPPGTKALMGTPLTSDATTGSYMVPTEFHAEVVRAMGEKSTMLQLVRTVPMGSRTKNVPVKATGVTLAWITSQGSEISETNPTFTQKTLTAYPLAAWISLTESLLDDDAAGLGEYFAEEFSDDLADELDNQVLNGTGTPWEGLLVVDGVNEIAMDEGKVNFSDVEFDDIMNLIGGITTQKYRRGASFVMNPVVLDSVRKIKDANGRPLFTDMTAADPARLAGYPVHPCDAAPGTSAAGTKFIVFGNFRHFLLGKRKELELRWFTETAQAAKYEEIFFRAYSRWAGVVAIPAAFATLATAAS